MKHLDVACKFLFHRRPFYVQFQVTARCNLRCRFCDISSSLRAHRELAVKEMVPIAENLAKLRLYNIVITGGEPLMREDLPHVVALFKRYLPSVTIQTNSLALTEEKARALASSGLDGLSVSLDSLNPDVQDFLNNRGGSWQTTMERIALISSVLGNECLLVLNTCFSPTNAVEIPSLISFAHDIGWKIGIVPVHAGHKAEGFLLRRDVNVGWEKQHLRIVDDVVHMKMQPRLRHVVFSPLSYLEQFKVFMNDGTTHWRERFNSGVCDSPNLYFAVKPDGCFAICHEYGTMRDVFVQDAEFPSRFDSLLEETRAVRKACPGCLYGCYPVYTAAFHSLRHFVRLLSASRLTRVRPKALSSEEILQLAETHRAANSLPCPN